MDTVKKLVDDEVVAMFKRGMQSTSIRRKRNTNGIQRLQTEMLFIDVMDALAREGEVGFDN